MMICLFSRRWKEMGSKCLFQHCDVWSGGRRALMHFQWVINIDFPIHYWRGMYSEQDRASPRERWQPSLEGDVLALRPVQLSNYDSVEQVMTARWAQGPATYLSWKRRLSGWSEWKWKSLSCIWPFATPWNSPGQSTGVGSLSLLQGIFPTQGLNPGLPHYWWILYQLSHKGSPRILEWVAYPFWMKERGQKVWEPLCQVHILLKVHL